LPFANLNNTRLFYRLEGRSNQPVLVLSHSLGCDHDMWAPQIPDLLQHFRVLRYDTRGHGASSVPAGDYTLEQLGRDVLALADSLGIQTFALCGLSMGGAVGQWLALNAPDRLTALVLANTSPKFGPADIWEARRRTAREGGMAALVDTTMQRWFSADMLAEGDPYVQSVRSVFLGTDPAGYVACCAALRDVDHTKVLGKIRVPTLVIGGAGDPSTPWAEHGAILARDIPGAKAVQLPGAHLSSLGRPHSFTAAVLEFLLPTGREADMLEAGLRMRREVLGADHVERSMAGANDFTRDFQTLLTRYAWGAVWSRPGLDLRTRRLLVLVILAAMGRWEEFRLHVRAALQHRLEPCDLKEALLQAAIYAGMASANTGFSIAREEMEKLGSG
jgi:3-oxoadipate enol-lactonase / 4-carboxymuconolactone decarboxylase